MAAGSNTLLYDAFKSQELFKNNSNGTLTFVQVARKLLEIVGITDLPIFSKDCRQKDIINRFGRKVKDKFVKVFKSEICNKFKNMQGEPVWKLSLYSMLKTATRITTTRIT